MTKIIDAHCHLSESSHDHGTFAGYVCNSVTESDWATILDLARRNPNVYPAVGLHPWYVSDAGPGWENRLRDALMENPFAMVGECGLDKLHPNYDTQLDAFGRHLQIARDLARPIHIHCVHAWNDLYHMLQGAQNIPAIIIHGFASTPQTAQQFANMPHVYFSFGRAVLDARRQNIRHALRTIPQNRILVESDLTMAESGDTLIQIAAQVARFADTDLNQIYKNTMGFLQNGQIKQN